MSNVGFRIFTKINRPEKEVVEAFRDLPVANIADCMNRTSCVNARIKPVGKKNILGVAFTVKSRAGDNLMLHKAIQMAEPGDVIVVDAQGDLTNSITGEIMMRTAMKKGIAGIMIDGAIRDVESLEKLDFSIYAAGVTPAGPYKEGPGEINVPISFGNVTICPGDILIGDADGVVVINPKDAAELLEVTRKKYAGEQAIFEAIEKGGRDYSRIDRELTAKGCEIVEDYYK